jgi:hypothetical protein
MKSHTLSHGYFHFLFFSLFSHFSLTFLSLSISCYYTNYSFALCFFSRLCRNGLSAGFLGGGGGGGGGGEPGAKKEKVRHYPAVMHPNMSFLLSRSSDEIQSLHDNPFAFSAVSAEMACRPASWEEEEEAAEEENQGPQ